MKTITLTICSLFFVCVSIAQLGNRTLGNKIATKDLGSVVSVRPGNLTLKDVGLPRSYSIRKTSKVMIPKGKLALPSRKKVKITPLRPFNPSLEIAFVGKYSRNYMIISDALYGGLLTFNAEKGKEYRMKVILADKNHLLADFNQDYPSGEIGVLIGDGGDGYSIPVSPAKREINFLFKAVQGGKIQITLYGIFTHDWNWGDELWLPIKSIQVDEI
ncbi:hypothetical protein AB8P51_08870 [Muriicola sp. SD30]|uniref:hypothetical protein n=1 Tax=Muriicola sp. SD30 TaxID=3240936 RepID=UPI00350FA91B